MEVRYFLANKKSWSDVTIMVNRQTTPKKGDVINVGKIKMTVQDVVDATSHGRPITKVLLEEVTPTVARILEVAELMPDLTVICIDEDVNEARKPAGIGMTGSILDPRMRQGSSTATDKVKIFRPSTMMFGNSIRSALGSMGAGYGVQVGDFGDVVTVSVTYSNATTGRAATQNYAILWQGDRTPQNPFKVYSNIARYRLCTGVDQCVSYIRSKASGLSGATTSVL